MALAASPAPNEYLADPVMEDADWPTFGWSDDIRPALAAAFSAGRPVVLATLYRVEGSAPRPAGAQMLFDGGKASGYFSGDCVEGDVARHAAEVLADGAPRRLHYGIGSPWIDIRLRCGGALHILAERILPDCAAARDLLGHFERRQPCLWSSNGRDRHVIERENAPSFVLSEEPFRIDRHCPPPHRLIVSGGDPGALAIAKLGAETGFETILVRPHGPDGSPPFSGVTYLRDEPAIALARLKLDPWTAYIGATHEDVHDLPACLAALRGGAGYVGMIGARVRASGRKAALAAAGAEAKDLARLHFSPGITGLGKAPWEVAVGIIAEVMRALNPQDRG